MFTFTQHNVCGSFTFFHLYHFNLPLHQVHISVNTAGDSRQMMTDDQGRGAARADDGGAGQCRHLRPDGHLGPQQRRGLEAKLPGREVRENFQE